ncbi:MAG: alcohol dehydrogenase catalytic domain-containing protein [Acetobacteraceae bacterium]|nr:alcohol dehydrogenase catalytic domain-containing protein [Acetobacteraceae bacterium]
MRAPGPAESVLQLETVPDPSPDPGQVVVAVEHCGVCYHDVVVRNGTLKAGVRMPVILGHEVAGRVAALDVACEG